MRIAVAVAAAALFAATAAQAQVVEAPIGPSYESHIWSANTGETATPGRDLVTGEVGFPGLGIAYRHGLTANSDVGLKFDILYSIEDTTHTAFGIGLSAPYRAVVARANNLSVLVHVDPGIKLYPSVGSTDDFGNSSSSALFGFQIPVGAQVGIQLANNLRGEVGMDLPMALYVTPTADFAIGPQFGAGLEYYLDRNMSVGLDTRFGSLFVPSAPGTGGSFAFRTQVVAGYRL